MTDADVLQPATGQSWAYTDIVKEHFFNPKNFLTEDPKPGEYNTVGEFGSPACGDIMRIWLKIDLVSTRILEMKWRTFGCASAIAATSMFSIMITENGGMTIEDALKITPQDILTRLGGLPTRKVHCSVLVDQAFKVAIENYKQQNKS